VGSAAENTPDDEALEKVWGNGWLVGVALSTREEGE